MSTAGPAALSWKQSCCILSHTAAVVAAGTGSLELWSLAKQAAPQWRTSLFPHLQGPAQRPGKLVPSLIGKRHHVPWRILSGSSLSGSSSVERRVAVSSTVPQLGSHVSPCHAAVCQGEPASSWLLNESPVYLEVVPGTPAR